MTVELFFHEIDILKNFSVVVQWEMLCRSKFCTSDSKFHQVNNPHVIYNTLLVVIFSLGVGMGGTNMYFAVSLLLCMRIGKNSFKRLSNS